jgi:hypothetical protein
MLGKRWSAQSYSEDGPVLNLVGSSRHLCDGLSRRDFLRAGALGGVGLSLPALLRGRAQAAGGAAQSGFGRARRCLLLFLTGGPPQLDTFDLKPHAPAEVRGELRPIATNVAGIHIGELCPRLARQADKYCIVRSVTHPDSTHTSAGYTMLTGAYHARPNVGAALVGPSSEDHPHFGALWAKARPPRGGGPAFVSLPEIIKDAGVNEFPGQGAGFLGRQFDPFRIEADTARTGFRLPDIALPAEVTAGRLGDRRRLLTQLDRAFRQVDRGAASADVDAFYGQAFDLIRSPAIHRALQLGSEPDRVRAAYGPHLFGQGCLLARRLLEAGVPLVTVYWHYEGPDDSPVWDTHENNFAHLRRRLLPPTDQAVATLLEDLSTRGLLEDTLVICMGEFGRTPRINNKAGRDHWPHVQSILLAGGGIRGGSVYGASDRLGAYPAANPVTPPDLVATFLHLLGVPPDFEIHHRQGQPVRACQGSAVRGLIV